MSLYGIYSGSFSIGYFLGGALIGGLIPMIVFFVKRRFAFGLLSVLACGLIGFLHSIASIVLGVVLLIVAIVIPRK